MQIDLSLVDQIARIEAQLVDHHDLPRVAQVLRASERVDLENRLAELRQRRDDLAGASAA